MRRGAVWALGGLVAALALALGAWLGSAQRDRGAPEAGAAATLTQRPFKDLQGGDLTLSRWAGSVVVVNFWATWCPPCREEIPGLIEVQRKLGPTGVQIVGIAVDSAEKTREYVADSGINYPVAIAGMETIDLVRALGNRAGALPFTVILDPRGNVSATHLGLMTVPQVEAAVRAARS